jgi:phosphatidylserine/phosphatidylglycerophosphate/cardiolipin synthase-like enzyme
VSQQVTGELQSAALFAAPAQLFDIKAAAKRVGLLPLVSPLNYLDEVGKAIRKAKHRVYIQQQYILAGDGVSDLLEIVHERARTCDVRIIVSPKFLKAWEQSQATLKAAGLFRRLRAQNLAHVIHCHNKGLIIDEQWAVVSSTNWSENSILRARETGFLIHSKELTGYYASVFEQDWQDAIVPQRVSAHTVALSPAEMA